MKRLTLLVSTALLFTANSLMAGSIGDTAPPSGCTADTLTSYLFGGSNDGCIVGLLVLSNFNFSSLETGGATLLDSDHILVNPQATVNGMGGMLTFSPSPASGFSVLAGQTADYFINWHFFVDPGPAMDQGGLSLDPPMNDVSIDQMYCINGGFDGRCFGDLYDLHVTTDLPTDTVTFNPPGTSGDIETHISLNGGTTGASFDAFTSTGNVIDTSAPEPSTILLGAAGLLSMILARKSRTC